MAFSASRCYDPCVELTFISGLLVTDLTMDRVGFKSLSGYRGATVDKGLTNKEIRVLAGPKYRQIRHSFSRFWAKNWLSFISISLYDAPAIDFKR